MPSFVVFSVFPIFTTFLSLFELLGIRSWFLRGGAAGALTGNCQVRVGLNLSSHISGKALEHPGVVGEEAVDLQAASHQHPVPGRLHWVDGKGVLVPHDVRLGYSCREREGGGWGFTKSSSCFMLSVASPKK